MAAARFNDLEPPCTDPYARWCGRGRRVTAAPMPIRLLSLHASGVHWSLDVFEHVRARGYEVTSRILQFGPRMVPMEKREFSVHPGGVQGG